MLRADYGIIICNMAHVFTFIYYFGSFYYYRSFLKSGLQAIFTNSGICRCGEVFTKNNDTVISHFIRKYSEYILPHLTSLQALTRLPMNKKT